MNIYKNIKTDKQYKASTGFSKEDFMELFLVFEKLYFPKKRSIYKDVPKPVLTNKKEALFFILHYLKAYPTLVNMGIYFGFSESTTSIYIELLKPILKAALLQVTKPIARNFGSQEDFDKAFEGVEDLIIDGVEFNIQRPQDNDQQKEHYSGKKGFHTLKALIISDKLKRALYISELVVGKTHDFTMFKGFLSKFDFSKYNVFVDLGFLGIDKHITVKELQIPQKKPRGGELTTNQKDENCTKSRLRIVVENTIAMVKRYFILRIENRMHMKNKLNEALEICGLLWNFKNGVTT